MSVQQRFTQAPHLGRMVFPGVILIGASLRAPITSLDPVLPIIQRNLQLNDAIAGLLNALPLL